MMILEECQSNSLVASLEYEGKYPAYLVCHLEEFRGGTDRSTGDDAAVLLDLSRLHDYNVQLVVGLVLGIESLVSQSISCPAAPVARSIFVGWLVGASYVDKIDGEHGQVLVEEVDAALVDTLGNGLADLMGTPALDHIKSRPAVLGLGSGRGSDKKAVLELSL